MATSSESAAFERGIDSVLQLVFPERAAQVVAFRGDPALQARLEELAEKSSAGELTPEERDEYVGYVRANKFVAILQRRAREHLKSAPTKPAGDS